MNILGVGPAEFVVILIIALIFAGPQRMLRWAYFAGQALAKLRVMWGEIMEVVQKEVNAAGFDIEVPRDLPTRNSLNKMAQDAMKPLSQPVETAMKEVEDTRKQISQAGKDVKQEVKTSVNDTQKVVNSAKIEATKNTNLSPKSSANGSTSSDTQHDADDDSKDDNSTTASDQSDGFGTWSSAGKNPKG